MRLIIRIIVNAFALWVVWLIPFLQVSVTPFPPGGDLQFVLTLLAVAAVFAVVNAIIGTVIRIVAFPIFVLTLGLATLLVNGILLLITSAITGFWGWGLTMGGFWTAVLAGIVLSLINLVFGVLLRPQKKRR